MANATPSQLAPRQRRPAPRRRVLHPLTAAAYSRVATTLLLLLLTALLSPSSSLLGSITCVDGLAAPPSGSSKQRKNGGEKRRKREYNYFAYGSNMCSATMTALRGLNPIASTAAVVPRHALRFNVPGTPLVEPSWASVEPVLNEDDDGRGPAGGDDGNVASALLHGVLYRLTEEEFSSVLSSEGVPFGYSVHRCRAVPYTGDGNTAGAEALRRAEGDNGDVDGRGEKRFVSAYTLRAARPSWRSGSDTAPSRSYLNVLIRGAEEFRLDRSYVKYLREIKAGPTPLSPGGEGMAGSMLEAAERRVKGGGGNARGRQWPFAR